MTDQIFDYVIVGGGTAGCVIAARLTEDPSISVALVEAGRDFGPSTESKPLLDPFPSTYGDPTIAWPNLIAEVGADLGDNNPIYTRQFTQGRILGGNSTINGMMAQRGLPSDYDEWEELGATGWGWDGVLPFFKKLEDDWDFGEPMHGKGGPITIRRCPRDHFPPFAAAIADVMEESGYKFNGDMNGYFGDCVTAVPLNNTPTKRVSVATAYLTKEVRGRSNFTLFVETEAEHLILDGKRVQGVQANRAGKPVFIRAKETILCAGALHSPLLMLRSGIGPARQLEKAGVTVVADRIGVGQNLHNHPAVYFGVHLPKRSMQSRELDTWATTLLRYSSGQPGCPSGDMQIFPTNRSSWHPLGWRIAAVGMFLYKPFSTGSVEITSGSRSVPPVVKFKLLSDKRDFDRIVDCVMKTATLLATPKMRAITNETFLPPGGQANALNRPGIINFVKSSILNFLFGLPFGLLPLVMRANLVDVEKAAKDRRVCERYVRQTAAGVHHVSGTCKIGARDDPSAVLDPQCLVYGVDGLRVADASVMPTVISANTHIPVLMIGEKVAQIIKMARQN